MATFSWIQTEEDLSPAALTVRAQTLSPNDQGQLYWDTFCPRRDVDSVKLSDITTLDERPAADRREWNARGRFVPMLTPAQRQMSIIPIEAYDKVDEQEMQHLLEGSFGNASIIQDVIGARLPDRADRLAMSAYRRLEIDFTNAWTLGTITQRNPSNASQTFAASFGFSASRLTTAPTAWNDSGVNAYDLFVAWYMSAIELSGNGKGAMLRSATRAAILADSPDADGGVAMSLARVEARISEDVGQPFRFYLNEQSIDVFNDGGTAVTRTKVWPAQRVAFIPADTRIGYTAFAPVRRAWEISNQVPDAGIDVRGVTVAHEESNGGRELTIEAQLNAMPVPDEGRVVVINAGV